ncbi:MAG TPA: DUF1553 domain-containing protein, partial [Planctomycetota bacterium]|nr:DUF1553 domain-containing protein [Planctomycetota bacterium]
LPILRDRLPQALEAFDFAEPSFVTGVREETTVASQALYLMNDDDVMRFADAFAKRLLATQGSDERRRALAFELAFGRPPTSNEAAAARSFFDGFLSAPPKEPDPPRDGPRADRRRRRPDRFGTRGGAAESPEAGRDAAWSAFCQGLFQCAEFRVVD